MSSKAQINANRQNAQKSTGPKTPEGKAAVAQNALKHGLTTTRDVVITEARADFEEHRNALIEDLNPQTPTESILAARIISLSWRLRRAVNIQDQAIDAIDDNIKNGESSYRRREEENLDPALSLGRIVYHDFKEYRAFERLLMYEKRIENSLYKTMKELKNLQKTRKSNQTDPYARPHVIEHNHLAPGFTGGYHRPEGAIQNPPPSTTHPQSPVPPCTFQTSHAQNNIPHPTPDIERSETPIHRDATYEIRNMKNKPNPKTLQTTVTPLIRRIYNQKASCPETKNKANLPKDKSTNSDIFTPAPLAPLEKPN